MSSQYTSTSCWLLCPAWCSSRTRIAQIVQCIACCGHQRQNICYRSAAPCLYLANHSLSTFIAHLALHLFHIHTFSFGNPLASLHGAMFPSLADIGWCRGKSKRRRSARALKPYPRGPLDDIYIKGLILQQKGHLFKAGVSCLHHRAIRAATLTLRLASLWMLVLSGLVKMEVHHQHFWRNPDMGHLPTGFVEVH